MTLFLLPPSETKRDGGVAGSRFALSRLRYRQLTSHRAAVLEALISLSSDEASGARALRLSARSAPAELARNRALRRSQMLPAIERYTGVLYDALGVTDWEPAARERATEHVVIQSALFGLIGANDPIPAYRLSHDSRVPELRLVSHWSAPVAAILARHEGPIIDLRSEAYAALGPIPERGDARFIRVVAVGDGGVARALSHANKSSKGRFLRSILAAGPPPRSIDDLIELSGTLGWTLRAGAPGELDLVVPSA